jgi:hypothetical protein
MEQPKSLSVQYGVYEAHAGGVAAGMVEAGHKAQANRVSAGQKNFGIVEVAFFAAIAAEVSPTITATCR